MASDRIVLRKDDGSGAGMIFTSRRDAERWLTENRGYAEEPSTAGASPAPATRAQSKAVKASETEDKAVAPPAT